MLPNLERNVQISKEALATHATCAHEDLPMKVRELKWGEEDSLNALLEEYPSGMLSCCV